MFYYTLCDYLKLLLAIPIYLAIENKSNKPQDFDTLK